MKDGERYAAMENLRESDGYQLVLKPWYKERREALVMQLLNVDNMKDFRETKYAVHALDGLMSLIEIMGDPEREPDLEDTLMDPRKEH